MIDLRVRDGLQVAGLGPHDKHAPQAGLQHAVHRRLLVAFGDDPASFLYVFAEFEFAAADNVRIAKARPRRACAFVTGFSPFFLTSAQPAFRL
ncbi:MAG: hypothetical protein L6R28_04515 [Planctomycetes bacterium]|nr:hypothetical protein [Planctomycetota bacterium]